MSAFLFYGLAWFISSVLHSLLAREAVKKRLSPVFNRSYRLIYNLFAVLSFAIVYGIGYWLYQPQNIYILPLWLEYFKFVMLIGGFVLMIVVLKFYDLGLFSGLTQLKGQSIAESLREEGLHFDLLHQWVRHPLYSASFLILWGRISSDFDVVTAVFASLYLIIGSKYEERALVRQFGSRYSVYKGRIPAFFPYKGRVETKDI